MYRIEFTERARNDLGAARSYHRRGILAHIWGQLVYQPTHPTRSRKVLVAGEEFPFEVNPPVWELRVGEYRVFYDVNEDEKTVYVRAIRRKLPHKTTEESL